MSLTFALLAAWDAWFTLSTVSVHAVSVEVDLEMAVRAHEVEAPLGGSVVQVNIALRRTVQTGNVLVDLDSREMSLGLDEVHERIASPAL